MGGPRFYIQLASMNMKTSVSYQACFAVFREKRHVFTVSPTLVSRLSCKTDVSHAKALTSVSSRTDDKRKRKMQDPFFRAYSTVSKR